MSLFLPVMLQEMLQLFHCFLEFSHSRKIYHPEMIRFRPVKTASVDQQHLFLSEKIQYKLLIVMNVIHGCIDLRENVKSRFRFYRGDSWDPVQRMINEFPLLIDPSARKQKLIGALITAQSICTMDCAGTLEQSRMDASIFNPSI